ncbi:substrate-binding domain-containing protein [Streptosporangium sp. NPDC023615]|uniref:substrate-binding domain-containing protein n=1 Tax=Streptosporangium sp. NPDC023615 TaxID=3154794 RepID=UPI003421392A
MLDGPGGSPWTCRRVAALLRDLSARARLDGLRAAIGNAGIPYDDGMERRGILTFEQGAKPGTDPSSLPGRPTATACSDDLQAAEVHEAARRAGPRIPDGLSVVGFTDVDRATRVAPPLITVRQYSSEMGTTAAQLAPALAAGRQPAQDRHELETTLVVRASTTPPPATVRPDTRGS